MIDRPAVDRGYSTSTSRMTVSSPTGDDVRSSRTAGCPRGISSSTRRPPAWPDSFADEAESSLPTWPLFVGGTCRPGGLGAGRGRGPDVPALEARRIPPDHRMSPNALSYLQFRQTFQRPEFAAFFAAVTGLELGASDDFGVHAMGVGDFLRAHSDDVKNRRIALVIYLSPEWDPAFGGTLVLTNPDGTDTRVEPRYNSIVIFDVLAKTSHLVEPITPEAGERSRFTIGGWYPSSA